MHFINAIFFLFISIYVDANSNHTGGYSWEFLVGVCRPVLQILTLF